MNDKIAQFLSVAFHPLLMPTYLLATLFFLSPEVIPGLQAYQSTNNEALIQIGFKENLLFLIFLSTFLMPSSLIYYLYKIKIINSLKMEDLPSRRIPYLTTFLLYLFFGLFVKYKLPVLNEISLFILSISACLFAVLIISFFWKISAHTIGIGGALGLFLAIYFKKGADQLFIPILISIVLVGLVSAARLKLNAHSPMQVIVGFGLGLSISVSSIYLYL
ncbi:MAG: phosphatase PAP2 family protein [Bacteroidota bacterium]